jgi:hypothetical protein
MICGTKLRLINPNWMEHYHWNLEGDKNSTIDGECGKAM